MLIHEHEFINTNLNSPSSTGTLIENHQIILSTILHQSIAILGRFEEGQGKLLENDTNVEVNQAGAWNIDTNALDGQPEKELLGRNTGEIRNPTVIEPARDVALVSDRGLELGVAGRRVEHVELEETGGGVQRESGDALGEKPHRQTV